MKLNRIPTLALALASAALLGGIAQAGPGPLQPQPSWVLAETPRHTSMLTAQKKQTTIALTGRRFTTEEDVPASEVRAGHQAPRYTNFGQGNTTVAW